MLVPSEQSITIQEVTIGCHSVGSDRRTFVVAEAGVNHNGFLDTALQMVNAAADAGADAVKFQMFCAAELVSSRAPTAHYQRCNAGQSSQRSMLEGLELSTDDFDRIKQHCRKRDIMFMATPFGLKELADLQQLGASAIKIASTDLANAPLIEAAAQTKLPLIVSTGASTVEEIHQSLHILRRHGTMERLILLHCVSCYPTPLEALNLRAIHTLQQTFNVPAGLSDHTTSIHTGSWAVAAGACLVEKHFTLDRSQSGPDHAMSLSPAQLGEYITQIRDAQRALGSGRLGMSELEAEVRGVAGRSVVAAVDIPTGTPLTTEMLTLKRPGTGVRPADLPGLVGRTARTDIAMDTVLSWEMVR